MRWSLRNRRSLTLLTWNVWFGLEKPYRRWTELLAIVRRVRPDVVAFQEATDPFLSMLRKEPWVKASYNISDPYGEEIGAYGNVIMVSSPLIGVEAHPLESDMDRKLVVARTTLAGSDWAVGAVHLESFRESAGTRGRQLEQTLEIMAPFPNAALLGDFNFCSSWVEENDRIPTSYVDLWPAVRSDAGLTVDTAANPLRLRDGRDEKRVRFDRILVRSPVAVPTEASLLGTKPIRGEKPSLFPSDHFGVLGKVRLLEGRDV